MYPSQVRARVLEDHRFLRGQLDGIEVIAASGSRALLRVALVELRASLRSHAALEERILAPALRDADSFGDVRCAQLTEHQRNQASQVESSLVHLMDPGARRSWIVDFVRRRMDDIRADMEEEERTLLDPTMLRDDTITISPSA